ncbi:MAG: dehydrogenase [Desulfobacteraceae bacterium]|nr:MAG: dehydrogenase [Desulfobacteraceae bacterium]
MSIIERKSALCGVCPGGCGIIASLENGKLIKVKPDKTIPYGDMCIRGQAAPEIVYSPDRLKTPLIRNGKKGSGKFRPATWDEALDLVVNRMQAIKAKHGAQAFVYLTGRGAFEQSLQDQSRGFLFPYGSPNMAGVGSICFYAFGVLAPIPTFGVMGTDLLPDIENSQTIFVWGANPITDSPPIMFHRIIKAKKRGAKIIAIDHMRSDIARRADRWVAVRSGTDGALALGMLRVIINEKLYDKELVEKWTVGFEDLAAYVQSFTPAEVERITCVPAQTVVNLAREIAATRHASLVTYTGLEYTNSGVQNIRTVFLLWALAGHLDVPGGMRIAPPAEPFGKKEKIKPPENIKPVGAAEYPLFCKLIKNAQIMEFPKAVLEGRPYPVKGLLINGSSTLTSYPEPAIWEKAYAALDFLTVIDLFMTKEAELYADVVLPAATYFEMTSYHRYPDYVRLREPVIAPVGQARNSLMIVAGIAARLGYGDQFPQTEEEVLQKAFALKPGLLAELKANPRGVRLEQPVGYKKYERGLLRRDGRPGFETRSGKIEIASSLLAEYGYDPLPVYVDPAEGPLRNPELHRSYPLILNTGARIMSTFRSQHLNIPSLVKLQDKPLVLINPRDAEKRGIASGDKVLVRTKRGELYIWADVTDKVVAGAVELNVGGGKPIQAEYWRDCNPNVLTDFNNRDPISGFPVFKALLCEIEKA